MTKLGQGRVYIEDTREEVDVDKIQGCLLIVSSVLPLVSLSLFNFFFSPACPKDVDCLADLTLL